MDNNSDICHMCAKKLISNRAKCRTCKREVCKRCYHQESFTCAKCCWIIDFGVKYKN